MNTKIFFATSLALCAIFFASCASVPKEPAAESARETAKPSKAEKAPDDPPNVAFAKTLRKHLDSDDIEGALDCFDTIPDDLRDDEEMQMLRASLLLSAGRTSEAAAVADSIQERDSGNLDALALNATIAAASGDAKKQDALLTQILEADPYNPEANIQKGKAQAAKRKYKLAYNYYKKALQNDPRNADALFGCGQMAYYIGSLKEAERSFQTILEDDSQNDKALAFMGKVAAENENYLRATKYIEQAISANPNDYGYYIDYGKYLRSQGKFADAESAWSKAVSINPDYFLAYVYRASLYQEQKKYKQSLSDYYSIARLNPKYYFAYEEIGVLEWREGNMEKARAGFKQALEASADNYSYELMIAATYIKQKKLDESKAFLEPCLKKFDRSSEEYAMLRLYHDMGGVNAEKAMQAQISKIDKTTKRGKMLWYMGLYYELRGHGEIAKDFYAKILSMQAPMFFEYQLAEWGMGK